MNMYIYARIKRLRNAELGRVKPFATLGIFEGAAL